MTPQSACKLRLSPAPEVLGKEGFGGRIELEAVLGLREAVTLVGEEHVGVVNPLLFERGDNLLGFCLLDPWVVGTLRDKERYLDVARPRQWRARPQKLLLGGRVADPALELLEDGDPVRGHRLEQGLQVGRADDVDRAGEDRRRERRPCQCEDWYT